MSPSTVPASLIEKPVQQNSSFMELTVKIRRQETNLIIGDTEHT